MGTSFYGGFSGKTGRGLICGGLCMEEGTETGVGPYRVSVGGPEEGGPTNGNFEKWMKGTLGMGHLSLKSSLRRAWRKGSFIEYPRLCRESCGDRHLISWGLT